MNYLTMPEAKKEVSGRYLPNGEEIAVFFKDANITLVFEKTDFQSSDFNDDNNCEILIWPSISINGVVLEASYVLQALRSQVRAEDAVDPEGLFRGLDGIRARAAIAAADKAAT